MRGSCTFFLYDPLGREKPPRHTKSPQGLAEALGDRVTLRPRLLLDSRVVALPRSSNPIVVTLSSLKPFFFHGLTLGGALRGPWWSIRPWNPIRTPGDYRRGTR